MTSSAHLPFIGFDRQTVIVTGAGNGLGRAYAMELARRGAQVVVNDVGCTIDGTGLSPASANVVVDEIAAIGGKAVASYESVDTAAGGEAIVRTAISSFGRVDAVINNAGILSNAPFHELTIEQIQRVITTNLLGAIFVAQPAFALMREQGYGRLVFTSSGAGLFGARNGANYAAAKAGLIGLSNSLAIEGAEHGIMSNVIAPAAGTRMAKGIRTEDIGSDAQILTDPELPVARWSIEDPVAMGVYLASDQCGTTQTVFSAAAGRFARAFVGVNQGWYPPTDQPATAEQVASALPSISEIGRYHIARSVYDEVAIARRNAPTQKPANR